MVPLNPQIIRSGSPDPNSRYPILTPFASAYWTGREVTDIAGAGVTTGAAPGVLFVVLPVHPAARITEKRTAIARKQEVSFVIRAPPGRWRGDNAYSECGDMNVVILRFF
jgi:hypothetical protein